MLDEMGRAKKKFTDEEWSELWSAGTPPADILRLAREPDGFRHRYVGLVRLSEAQLDEYDHARLVPGRQRRTKAEMARFRLTLYEVVRKQEPMTVRQVFYQMVGRGLPKLETEYARVQQELVKMRRGEAFPQIPYGWIADNTRWMRKPTTYASLESALQHTARAYRRDLWLNQPDYVEVWLEKDALAGVAVDVTDEWDVPLMVARGFSSVSFLYEAASSIRQTKKPAHIYLLTDGDRSGQQIAESIERTLHELAPGAEIHCHRAAITREQVEAYHLPTRPPKRKGDPPAVELDALPADVLRDIIRDCIEQHVDRRRLRWTRSVERQEQETLQEVVRSWRAA